MRLSVFLLSPLLHTLFHDLRFPPFLASPIPPIPPKRRRRSFFFTFIFAYLADALGFKYFGALAGVMFVVGGLGGLLQYPLGQHLTGTCHGVAQGEADTADCSPGLWALGNVVMTLTIAASLMFSYQDWKERRESPALHSASSQSLLSLGGNAEESESLFGKHVEMRKQAYGSA